MYNCRTHVRPKLWFHVSQFLTTLAYIVSHFPIRAATYFAAPKKACYLGYLYIENDFLPDFIYHDVYRFRSLYVRKIRASNWLRQRWKANMYGASGKKMRCWRKCNRKLYSIIFAETICIRFAFTTLFSILYEIQKSVQLRGLTKRKCQSSTQSESENNKEQKYQLCINVYEETLHPYNATPSRLSLASKQIEIAWTDTLAVYF